MSTALLEVEDLCMRFGGLAAVDQVALRIETGQVVALIGPNGAGKTTVFNCLTGFYRPTSGRILFEGLPIQGLPSNRIATLGMVRTFQNIRLFRDMTVVENLMVAQHNALKGHFLSGLLSTPAYRERERTARLKSREWLERVDLLEFANRPAGTLAYGQQRRLEIARCMVTGPRLLMLDEPAAGLNPRETQDLKNLLSLLQRDFGVTVVLIEHDMHLVMSISDQVYVLNQGRPLAEGSPETVRNHPDVIKAYLGES